MKFTTLLLLVPLALGFGVAVAQTTNSTTQTTFSQQVAQPDTTTTTTDHSKTVSH
jgi:hypothetical protein